MFKRSKNPQVIYVEISLAGDELMTFGYLRTFSLRAFSFQETLLLL